MEKEARGRECLFFFFVNQRWKLAASLIGTFAVFRHLCREKPVSTIVSDSVQIKVLRQKIDSPLMDISGKYIKGKYVKRYKTVLFYIYLGKRSQEGSENILFSECSFPSPLTWLSFEQHRYSALWNIMCLEKQCYRLAHLVGELVPFLKKPRLYVMTSFLIKVEIDYCAHIT